MRGANRQTMRRTVLAAVAALALAGCGGSTPAAHVSSTGTVTRTVTTPPTSTTSTSTSPTATTPTVTAINPTGSGACTSHDLAGRFLSQNGATGNVVLELALRNTGSTPCHSYGYPGVQFVSKTGAPLPTAATRTTQDLLGSTRLAAVTLGPGQEASFRMVAATDRPGGGSCPSAYGLRIIAPDDTVPIAVTLPAIYECGRTTVSPLEAGTGASPGV